MLVRVLGNAYLKTRSIHYRNDLSQAPTTLSTWLNCSDEPKRGNIAIIELKEICPPNPQILDYLSQLMLRARFNIEFLSEMAEIVGWTAVKNIINASIPTLLNVSLGDFGEVLTIAMLEEFRGYKIPVQKLRYKIKGNQTLPGSDAIGIRIDKDEITELCYVESKLRTSDTKKAAVEGYTQLVDDYDLEVPAMLVFVLATLRETKSPLYNVFQKFLRDRRNDPALEKFHLSLIWEKSAWSDEVIALLEKEVGNGPELDVSISRIDNIGLLRKEVQARSGVEISENES
jgi:hypothetical protein